MTKWFENKLKTIMSHNEYKEDWLKASVCDAYDKWTPCDLIAREYLNNGGGSAKGFLGILPSECIKCYKYMCEIKSELIENDMISKDAWNNFGITLWTNYNFDR